MISGGVWDAREPTLLGAATPTNPSRVSQVLVKVNPEGKYVVDIDKDIDVNKCTPNTRVALRNDSYVLHKILPTKVTIVWGVLTVRVTAVCCTRHPYYT